MSLTLTSAPAFLLKRPPPSAIKLPPWHVIRTVSGTEMRVAEVVSTFSPEVYCPRYRASYVVHQRKREVVVPYLRTYLFARWEADDAHTWHDIRSAPGVLGFIGNNVPDPVAESEIDRLRTYIGEDGELVGSNFLRKKLIPVGSPVLINRHAFATYSGTVEEADADGIFVSVKIGGLLGRDVVIRIASEWCDRLETSGALSQTSTAQRGPRRLSRRRRERSKRALG